MHGAEGDGPVEPRPEPGTRPPKRVLLVGAGVAGTLVIREIHDGACRHMQVVGFVDDDRLKIGSHVQGVEVLGATGAIPELAARLAVDEIILCIPAAPEHEVRRILSICRTTNARIKTLPPLHELLTGKATIAENREVELDDLLGREPIRFDREAAADYVAGRVVMVTGAGGSIGSELCRQIAGLRPSKLVLVGRGEFSIYSIELELRERFPDLALVPLIADVRDLGRMTRAFAAHRPAVVFHAAAHKHVPLMEGNPGEAVLNNVFGTRVVASLAAEHGAETFVLISSDKAVNPTNVMGATKRASEMVVQDLATRSATRFLSVRFGNVLGSRGSVVPLFRRQIAQGGPITITHPDVIRYFMTIPEAVQLVLQAGAIAAGGEVFVLDMGEPVRIVDLARDLIRLSGLEPDVDIEIRFTGLRPGEKLYEELLTVAEGTTATRARKIFVARPEPVDRARLEAGLTRLRLAATAGDDQAVRRGLKALVETYVERSEAAQARSGITPPAPRPRRAAGPATRR